MNGSEQAGKKLYFIALFPYFVLTIFLIMGLTSDGGLDGLRILLSPDWEEIMNAQIWVDAAGQIFYSFGLCYGGIIAFSSYNPLTQDIYRDSLIIGRFYVHPSIIVIQVRVFY